LSWHQLLVEWILKKLRTLHQRNLPKFQSAQSKSSGISLAKAKAIVAQAQFPADVADQVADVLVKLLERLFNLKMPLSSK
jgi:hypothetical protein